jgi:segregation and condensation protein B
MEEVAGPVIPYPETAAARGEVESIDPAGDALRESSPERPPEEGGTLGRLEQILESVLFAAATPVSLRRLTEVLDGPAAKEVQAALGRLKGHYGPGRRGIQLQEVAGGYQLRTARENAEWVRAVFRDKPARLGRAALETLAIVAYKQPVTRAEIETIRGVDVDGVLATLLSRRLIKISGRKEAVGRPLLYSTTAEFLETFGLKDVNELPSLKELGPPDDVCTTTNDAALAPAAAAESATDTPPPADPREPTAEPTAAVAGSPGDATAAAGSTPRTPPETAEPGGDDVPAQSRGADPRGADQCERPGGDRAGDESESPDRPDHG